MRFIPTGGIGPAELADYLRHPAVLAVGGSWLVERELLAAGDFDAVRRLAAEAKATATAARDGHSGAAAAATAAAVSRSMNPSICVRAPSAPMTPSRSAR